jgi:hypothetical protein
MALRCRLCPCCCPAALLCHSVLPCTRRLLPPSTRLPACDSPAARCPQAGGRRQPGRLPRAAARGPGVQPPGGAGAAGGGAPRARLARPDAQRALRAWPAAGRAGRRPARAARAGPGRQPARAARGLPQVPALPCRPLPPAGMPPMQVGGGLCSSAVHAAVNLCCHDRPCHAVAVPGPRLAANAPRGGSANAPGGGSARLHVVAS